MAEAAVRHACHVHRRVRGLGCRRLAEAGCGICRAGSRLGTDSGVGAGLLCVGSTAPCKTRSPIVCCRGTLQALLPQLAMAGAAWSVPITWALPGMQELSAWGEVVSIIRKASRLQACVELT